MTEIKDCIRKAQIKTVISVNSEMILMCWDIGKIIYNRQQLEGWGTGVISRLSNDIHNELPEIKGFSERNIKFMVQLYKEYELDISIRKQPVYQLDFRKQLVSQIPWGHNILLMQKIKDRVKAKCVDKSVFFLLNKAVEMDANMVVNPLRGNRKGFFYSRKTLVAKRLKMIKEFIKAVFFAALLIRVTVLSAVSYDDYQQYRRQAEQPTVQRTVSSQRDYFYPASLTFSYRSEFVKNPDNAPLIALARFDHNLQNFLQEKVAPNLKISDYAGYIPREQLKWENYSSLSDTYEIQSFERVVKNGDDYKSLELTNSRGGWKVTEKIDHLGYGADHLPKQARLITTDLAGNTYRQEISNLVYQRGLDQSRLADLKLYTQIKAAEDGTYGFGQLWNELKDKQNPPCYQASSFRLEVEDCQGKETAIEFSALTWSMNQITGFTAKLPSSVGAQILLQVTSPGDVFEVSALKNNKLVVDRAMLGKDLSVSALIEKLQLGVNPLEILGSSKIQLGEAQLVFLAKTYNTDEGTLPGGGKQYNIDYGITAKKSLENEIKIRLAQLEQTAPWVTRAMISGRPMKNSRWESLSILEKYINKMLGGIVERDNLFPQYAKIKNDWQLELKPVNGLNLKLENGRLYSDGKFATNEGVLSEVNFVYDHRELKAISGVYRKNDGQTIILTSPKAEAINNLMQSIAIKRGGLTSQLKDGTISLMVSVTKLFIRAGEAVKTLFTEVIPYRKIAAPIGYKTVTGAENAVIRPVVFTLAAIVGVAWSVLTLPVSIVKDIFSTDHSSVKTNVNQLKENIIGVVGLVAKSVAGIVGYALSYSPGNSAVHKLSEKLDNWSLKGTFVDDSVYETQYGPKKDAEILVINGIGNNVFDTGTGSRGELLNFSDLQKNSLKDYLNVKEKDKVKKIEYSELVDKMDFVANYTGNSIIDVVFSAFEKIGWPITSRKIMENYKGMEYKMVYAHSAGGYVYLNHFNEIKSQYRTFIGAEGTHLGKYNKLDPKTTFTIVFEHDVVPHVGPLLETRKDRRGAVQGVLGAEIRFGNGGVAETPAPGHPKWYDEAGNHDYRKYVFVDMPRLVSIFTGNYLSDNERRDVNRINLEDFIKRYIPLHK